MHTRGDGSAEGKEKSPGGTAPPLVEYAPSHLGVSRRQWRVLIALTLLNTLMLGYFVIGPQSTQFIQSQSRQFHERRAKRAAMQQILTAQQQCLDHVMPAGLVVYEERPEQARELVAEQPDYVPWRVGSQGAAPPWVAPAIHTGSPPGWKALTANLGTASDAVSVAGSLLFLGQRTAALRRPAARRRALVGHAADLCPVGPRAGDGARHWQCATPGHRVQARHPGASAAPGQPV